MVTMQVPNFCTITQVCQKLGFTYYTVSYWLDNNLVKWVPAGSKRLINMEAVSYTHLDVYKRQRWDSELRFRCMCF